MLEARPRTLLRAFIAGAAMALAAPSLAGAADQLNLIDKTEPVGPGITLKHQKFLNSSGWYDEQVLTVDLSNSAVKSDLLTAPHVAQGEALSSMASRAGAAAGVNGDFFDIDSTQASLGGEIQAGQLIKSADASGWAHVGVSKTGLGQLVDMTLQASADLNGTVKPILTLNAANSGGVPAGSIIAYTSAWGSQIRSRSVAGVANVAEVLVQDDKVVEVHNAAGTGAIPDGAYYLVGRDAGADAIKALKPGDPVKLTYGLKDSAAQQMQWAIGTNKPLIQNGVALPQGDTSVAPRTAIGFKDGGKTMFLLITDGRQTQAALGTTLAQTAQMLLDLGADTGLNLDGGGSTTLVARPLGGTTATLRNTPSDGQERADPTGIGLFVGAGNGKVGSIVVSPEEPRIFPGLHRTLTGVGLDDHQTRVSGATWTRNVSAPADAKDDITATATIDGVTQDTKVHVLHPLRTLELSSNRLSYADALPNLAQTLKVVGRDDEGYTAPIELQDMTLDYDHDLIKVEETEAGSLKITPLKAGGTTLDVKVGDQEEKLPITIGVVQNNVYTFNHADEATRWNTNGTVAANQKIDTDADGNLRLTYKAERNSGVSAKTGFTIAVPGAPLRLHLKFTSTQALQFTYLSWRDAGNVSSGPLGAPVKVGDNDVVFTLPSTTKFPITITSSQVIETNAALQKDGVVAFKSIDADYSATVASPPADPLKPDALFSADGTTNGKDDWSFGTLSDVQFTAANPTLAKVGVAAIERIRKTNPDLIVLNGDITDNGAPEDVALARTTLEQGGCQLIPLQSTIGKDDTPAPTADKTPCYYVPGNHESYRAGAQGDLAPFIAQFGQPYGTFDHNGTRFILLASSLRQPAQHQLGADADVPGGARRRQDRPRGQERHGLRPPPGGRPGRDGRLAARRPRRGRARGEDAVRLPHGLQQGRVDGRLARADRRRAPHRGRAVHGAAVLGQGPVRHTGSRWLHRLAGLACRQGRERCAAVADGGRPRVRAVDHAERSGRPGGGRPRAAGRLDRAAAGRHQRHAGRAAALPDVGPLQRLRQPRDRHRRRGRQGGGQGRDPRPGHPQAHGPAHGRCHGPCHQRLDARVHR